MKRADFSVKQLLEIVLAVVMVFILFFLVGKLLDMDFDSTKASGDSYFKTFMREIEKADDEKVGEFIMWQSEKDKGKQDVFLIYFNDKFIVEFSDMTFVTYGSKNIICACFWDGLDGFCESKNCVDMKYPIENSWTDDKMGQWWIGNGDGVTIEREGKKYLVKKIKDGTGIAWSQVKVDDLVRNKNGEFYVVNHIEKVGEDMLVIMLAPESDSISVQLDVGLSELLSKEGYEIFR